MKQREIIELRSVGPRRDTVEQALKEMLVSSTTGPEGYDVTLFRHAEVETDLAVHIVCEGRTVLHDGSRLGHHLVEFLRRFGLVNHDLWISMEPMNEALAGGKE